MSSKQRSQGKSLSQLLSSAKKNASAHPRRSEGADKKQALTIKSISLTPDTVGTLDELCSAVSEQVGWKVPASAIVRGLLSRYGGREGLVEELAKWIHAERNTGTVVWGKTPQR